MTAHHRKLPPVVETAMLADEGLRAPDDLAEAIMDIKDFLAGDIIRDGIVMPRFGVLSLKARATPMYVFDHPALKEISATSFSDGQHIFINADFMRKLMDEEDASNGEQEGVVPLLLHNLTHMILRHHHRFERFPSMIADIGADMSINAKLRLAYPDMKWVPSLLEVSPGASLPPADMRRMAKLAEETIIRELLSAHNHLLDQKTPPEDEEEPEDEADQQASDKSGSKDPKKGEQKKPKDPNEKGEKGDAKNKSKDKSEQSDSDEQGDEPSDDEGDEQDGQDGQEQDGEGQPSESGEPGEGDPSADGDGSGEPSEEGQPGGQPSPDGEDGDGPAGEAQEQLQEGAPQKGAKPSQKKSRAARPVDPEAIKELLKEMKAGGEKAADGNTAAHSIPLQQMAEVLENNNLESTKERLDIPDSEDQEKIDHKEEQTQLKDIHDIARSVQMAGQKGTMGGGHIEQAAHEMVKGITEGKISWKLGVQQMILGDGMKFGYSEEVPGDLYYVDAGDMGMNMELFVGQDLPMKNQQAVMVLLDTSGSITQELFDMFLSEILALAKSQNPESDQASEVIMLMCDDVLRGQPIIIDENNVDEIREKGMQVQGRGGNDIGGTIRAASKLELFREKNVRSIVYFTDLGDSPPRRTDCPPNVSLSFVCPPADRNEEFIRAVKDFARVYPIDEGIDVVLDEDEAMANTQMDWKPKEGQRRAFSF